jgi:hypothetical protein
MTVFYNQQKPQKFARKMSWVRTIYVCIKPISSELVIILIFEIRSPFAKV